MTGSPVDPAPLLTERLALRPVGPGDAGVFADLWSDPRVTEFLGARGKPKERSVVLAELEEKWIPNQLAHWCERGFGMRTIREREGGAAVGYSGLRHLADVGEVEVLYGLAPAAWGKGYATEASRAVVADGFSRCHLARIVAFAWDDNLRSRGVLGKLGLTYEKKVFVFGVLDVPCYAVSRAQWMKDRATT